jgi:hypothetical protein
LPLIANFRPSDPARFAEGGSIENQDAGINRSALAAVVAGISQWSISRKANNAIR